MDTYSQHQPMLQPQVRWVPVESILHIDSRFAERMTPGSNLDFYVPLVGDGVGSPGETFKQVVSVELQAVHFRGEFTSPAEQNEPYVVIDIDELNNNVYSNNPVANRAFAVVHAAGGEASVTGRTIRFDRNDQVKHFARPLDSLNRITVRVKVAGAGASPSYHGFVTMILKVVHLRSA